MEPGEYTTIIQVEKLTCANRLRFPPAPARRPAERVLPYVEGESDVGPQPGMLDPLFARALFLEARRPARRDLPFGLSVAAAARKEPV